MSVIIPAFMTGARRDVKKSNLHDKAQYYTRQAYKYTDSIDEAYELYHRALQNDPAQAEAGFNFALYSLMRANADTSMSEQWGAMMKRYVDANPGDIDEASLYAYAVSEYLGNPAEAVRVQERLLTLYPKRTDIYMTLAEHYNDMGDLPGALGAIRRYEHIEGMDTRTSSTKAGVLMMQGDTAAALWAVDSLIMLHPDEPDSWGLKGELYSMLQKNDSAQMCLQKAIELAPYKFAPKMMLADFYREQGDSLRADDMMTQALATNDLDVDEKAEGLMEFIRGLVNNNNDVTRAFPMIDALLQQEPESRAVLSIKAAVEFQLNDYRALEGTLRDILAIDGNQPNIWQQLMIAHINDSDFKALPGIYEEAKKAVSDYDPALDIYLASGFAMDNNPNEASAVILRAIHHFLPSYTDMMPPNELLDSIKSKNYNPKAVANMLQLYGDQFVTLTDTVKGMRIYDQALTLDPDNYMTLNNYAYFLALRDTDLDKASVMSQKTVNAHPDNGTFLDTYAYILFKKHDYERARMYQEMAMENTPEADVTAELLEHYGDILFMLGDNEKALSYWKKALVKSPDRDILKRKVQYETYFYK